MSSVGEELRRERELRGISLEEIADATKIGVRFLRAIDTDQLEIIPGEFYRRASLKAYARYLGLDEDRIVATYQFRAAAKSSVPEILMNGGSKAEPLFSRTATKWVALVLAALGLSGAAVAVWPGGEREEASIPSPAKQFVGGLNTDEQAGDVAVENARPNNAAVDPVVREVMEEEPAAQIPLRLLFRVDDACWMEIHADDNLVARGLMHQGLEKEVQAVEEIRLWLGNAGGVSFWINDRPVKPLGRSGQVRKDVRITPENVAEFLSSEGESNAAEVQAEVR